jgi:hypothetical protein
MTDYPLYKWGARWICEGPDGHFHARTKTEALRMLTETLDRTMPCPECGTEMIRSPRDPSFLIHVESTDCAPEPWPTLKARTR